MKKLYTPAAMLIFLFLLTECSSLRRFRSARYVAEDNTLVNMELFGTRLTAEGPDEPTSDLWDLSAGAQTQLIQILDGRYPDNGTFINALNNIYLRGEEDGLADYTRRQLRMVFTISRARDYSLINRVNERFSPADRIEYLTFSLEIPEQYNLRYRNWNRFATEYGEIEIADVSFSRSIDLDIDVTPGERSSTGTRGLVNRQEEQEVRSRFLKLNGSISDHRIRVEEEGTREIDLTGNVIADVSLEFEGFPEKIAIPLFVEAKQEDQGTLLLSGLRLMDVVVPHIEEAYDTIKAVLTCDYIYRHVQSGWKTYQEWDDRVEYYKGTVQRTVPLFTGQEYLPGFYCIGPPPGTEDALKIGRAADRTYLFQFSNYADAIRVLEWLESLSPGSGDEVTAGDYTLYHGGAPLRTDRLQDLGLKVLPVY